MSEILLEAIKNIFTVTNILMAAGGTFVGIIFGALPGFTAAMGVAVLLPITFGMPPASGLILLGALFGGAMYGGSISAILINTPGTPSAAATVLDGHPMAKKGWRRSLAGSRVCLVPGRIFGVTVLLLLLHPCKDIFNVWTSRVFSAGRIWFNGDCINKREVSNKGLMAGVFGLLVSTIGMDPLMGTPRFTMGVVNLIDGVKLVPAMIGLFSIPETLNIISSYINDDSVNLVNMKEFRKIKIGFPSWDHIKRHAVIYLKSSVIGTYVGMLPGAGGSIASFMAYNEAKRSSKHPEKFGTGISEGIAAAESANNAMAGGALIPMLTLGVPGDSVAAIIMGGLMVHGLEPGAQLFARNGDIAYTFILALYLANIMMLLFGIYCAPYFTIVTNTPKHILSVCVMLLTVIGAYALRGNIFDVYVMVAFGFIGYFLKCSGFPIVPVVLGIILGPIAEKGLNSTITISYGENILLFMLSRPISLILIVFTVLSVGVPLYHRIRRTKKEATESTD